MSFWSKELSLKKEDWFAFVVLSFAIIFNFCIVSPILSGSEPYGADNSYHFLLTYNIVQGTIHGNNVLDLWFPYMNAGHAVEQYYQHFPHIFTAFLYFLFLEKVPLILIYKGIIVALLTFLPLSFYYAMRVMGSSKGVSSLAGFMSLLISSNCSYGLEYCSFFGWGLFTQLFATFLFPLYLASIYSTAKHGKHIFFSVLFLCLVFTSHIIFGVMAVITSIILIFSLKGTNRFSASKRVVTVFLFAGLILSYWIVPMYINKDYFTNPTYSKNFSDSYGISYVISGFLTGKLLDFGRPPVFTILVFAGLLSCIFNRREIDRFLLLGFFLWTILFIGKGDIWILNFMPLSEYLIFFRFINGFHIFAIMLAATGIYDILIVGRKYGYLIASIAFVLALLYPMVTERVESTSEYVKTFDDLYLGENRTHFDNVNLFLSNSEPGRIFVGTKTGLGTHFIIALVPAYSGKDVLVGGSYSLYSPCFSYTSTFNDSTYDLYDLFNVRYILSNNTYPAPDFAEQIFESGYYKIYRINTSGYFGFTGPNERISSFDSAEFNNCGHIISEDVGYNYYSSVVDIKNDCSLFLKVANHPDWIAYVDGVRKNTNSVSPCFMGIDMDEGQHKVEFYYKTSLLKIVLFIFGLGIITLLLLYDLRKIVKKY